MIVEPLSTEAFAPFGHVIEMAGHSPLTINQGFALRFDDLAFIDCAMDGGQVKVSLFEARPRPVPIQITMMERHPLGSQLFMPLQDQPWLVVVCTRPDDEKTFRAFAATGQQGVNYARGVWHFPLIVRSPASRFIIVDRKGPGNNLEEMTLPSPLIVSETSA